MDSYSKPEKNHTEKGNQENFREIEQLVQLSQSNLISEQDILEHRLFLEEIEEDFYIQQEAAKKEYQERLDQISEPSATEMIELLDSIGAPIVRLDGNGEPYANKTKPRMEQFFEEEIDEEHERNALAEKHYYHQNKEKFLKYWEGTDPSMRSTFVDKMLEEVQSPEIEKRTKDAWNQLKDAGEKRKNLVERDQEKQNREESLYSTAFNLGYRNSLRDRIPEDIWKEAEAEHEKNKNDFAPEQKRITQQNLITQQDIDDELARMRRLYPEHESQEEKDTLHTDHPYLKYLVAVILGVFLLSYLPQQMYTIYQEFQAFQLAIEGTASISQTLPYILKLLALWLPLLFLAGVGYYGEKKNGSRKKKKNSDTYQDRDERLKDNIDYSDNYSDNYQEYEENQDYQDYQEYEENFIRLIQ